MTILNIQNIGKSYKQYKSEWHRFARWFGFKNLSVVENRILSNINFTLQAGEALGIIGQNGAGKSTLLKIITGVLKPTEGYTHVNGRVSAILELGMGFNPELTGHQNSWHALSLMGIDGKTIQGVMPQIEEFSEIGEYFNQPVRIYSSGMAIRVAFAVATALRPDILIIDEALAVGDSYFQHKCFDRILAYKKQGTALLLVSHDHGSIIKLCDQAILLDKGNLIGKNSPQEICNLYNEIIAIKDKEKDQAITKITNQRSDIEKNNKYGTGEATIDSIHLLNGKNKEVSQIFVGEKIKIKVITSIHENLESLVLGFSIKDRLGQIMFGTNSWHTKQIIKKISKGSKYSFTINIDMNLGPGSYSLQLALVDKDTHLTANYEWRDFALVFDVVNKDKFLFTGLTWLNHIIDIKKEK